MYVVFNHLYVHLSRLVINGWRRGDFVGRHAIIARRHPVSAMPTDATTRGGGGGVHPARIMASLLRHSHRDGGSMAENCHQGERGMLDYAHIQKLYIVRNIDKLSMAELSKLSMAEYRALE